ncbi:MAG: agmatinase [Candidatus Micrarchaeota archaeon]|nr:agmatinase [Candidatus Micrarchaeota archaeon]
MPPYNLFGLEDQEYKRSKVVVLPIPYDAMASYGAGTRNGPHAIIEASRNVELYDAELGYDISDVGIFTTEELAPDRSSPQNMAKRVEKEVSLILEDSKMPFVLGGDHSVSIGAINAAARKAKSMSVLQFDAHSDAREEYEGTKYSHACVMARAMDACGSCYSAGVRSTDRESDSKRGKSTLYMHQMRRMSTDQVVKRILESTRESVYITVDVDVLDPGEMPSTGTPEPGGMGYQQLKEVLGGVIARRKVVGMDIVELSPIGGMRAPDFLAARLAYMMIGYAFAKKGRRL